MYLESSAILIYYSMQAFAQTVCKSSLWDVLLLLLQVSWSSQIRPANWGTPTLWMLMSIKNLEFCSSQQLLSAPGASTSARCYY